MVLAPVAGVKLSDRRELNRQRRSQPRTRLRGDHGISRKAIAQGRPGVLRCPVCSCALCFVQIARGTAGAASTRSSLRPLFKRRANEDANLGRSASRECETVSAVIVREGGRSSIPETAMIEPIGRGVLDPRRSLSSGSPKARPGGGGRQVVLNGTS